MTYEEAKDLVGKEVLCYSGHSNIPRIVTVSRVTKTMIFINEFKTRYRISNLEAVGKEIWDIHHLVIVTDEEIKKVKEEAKLRSLVNSVRKMIGNDNIAKEKWMKIYDIIVGP